MICSAMMERVHKHGEHHDSGLLTMSGWYHQLVALAASGLGVKIRETCYRNRAVILNREVSWIEKRKEQEE